MKTVHLDVTAADTQESFREGVGPAGVSPGRKLLEDPGLAVILNNSLNFLVMEHLHSADNWY